MVPGFCKNHESVWDPSRIPVHSKSRRRYLSIPELSGRFSPELNGRFSGFSPACCYPCQESQFPEIMNPRENPVSAAGDSPPALASLTEEERATALERFRVLEC